MLKNPICVYVNWAAYDELSDTVELTEELALRQLDELARLKALGVRFDYYLMDAFWYAPDGAYRTWRQPHWPDGPDRWLARCREVGVLPGIWVMANTLCKMDCPPAWRDSLDEQHRALCCFYGGYLHDFVEALHGWYARGLRAFKFDFANFMAAPEKLRQVMLPSEIRAANVTAWRGALKAFRRQHPDVLLIAYNGYEEAGVHHGTGSPLIKALDLRWLEVFDSLYCGDPRPADVPAMNFWRAKDVYSDHLVRLYEWNGIPLKHIDNAGFMIGTTGTCYNRCAAAWQGMLILSLARGGWVNTYYGNLDLLDEAQGRWFAKVQEWYLHLQTSGEILPFGDLPGTGNPYGFAARDGGDALLAVVNPGQAVVAVPLPVEAGSKLRLLFRDAGFEPVLVDGAVRLGPEQMALVGVGRYACAAYDLGEQEDVSVPHSIRLLATCEGAENEKRLDCALTDPPRTGRLRIVMRQHGPDGQPLRAFGGPHPKRVSMDQILRLRAEQDGRDIPVTIAYDKRIWSGLSWAVGEVEATALTPNPPLKIQCESKDPRPLTLDGALYLVDGEQE